jgi:hypothetical protein
MPLAPPITYSYGPPHHPGGYPYYQWPMPQPVEYISDIKPDDVLSGRGGATNSHSGNRSFRSLVKRYQEQYLRAKKRDKPAVASLIVEAIRVKHGRFLRRIDTTRQGQVLWIDIGDDRAREKTCQALREGAPALRRKRKSSSVDEEDTKQSDYKETDAGLSSSSSIERTASGEQGGARARPLRTPFDTESSGIDARGVGAGDGPIMIKPSPRLMRRRILKTISVDHLEAHDRELYLRDFLPPNPAIRRKPTTSYFIHASTQICDSSERNESTSPWPVVQV